MKYLPALLLLTACAAHAQDIAGPDKDHNGVRDDVQVAIAKKYRGPLLPHALKVARQFQRLLVLSARPGVTSGQLSDVTNHLFSAETCVYKQFGFDQMREMGDFIEGLTMNTSARVRAYQRGSELMSGTMFSDSGTACRS